MQATDSAETQIARAKRKADAGELNSRRFPNHTFEILDHWIMKDEALSGKTAGRDGYQIILQGIRDQQFEILLVDDFSRLTRDMGDLLDLYDLAKWHDVEVISVCEGISSADDQSKQFFMLKGLVNQLGNDAHAQRTISRMEEHFITGFSTGSIPYGYTTVATQKQIRKGREYECRARIMIHEERAAVVRRIFEMSVEGMGRNEIANRLNQELVPSPTNSHRKDGPLGAWNASTIKTILCNERYVGIWAWRKSIGGRNPDTKARSQKRNDPTKVVQMRPEIAEKLRIIPQDIWNKLADRRETTRKAIREANNKGELIFGNRLGKNGADHLLSGLLRCSECGANLVLASGNHGGYYGCNDVYRGTGRCTNKALIKRSRLEESLLETLHMVLSKDDWIKKLAKRINHWRVQAQDDTPRSRKVIEKELSGLDKEIANLVEFVVKGNHSETICAALAARERRKGLLQAELRKLAIMESHRKEVTPAQLKPHLMKFLSALKENPKSVSLELGKLFPNGIKMTPPTDRLNRGTWTADITLDGGQVLFFPAYNIKVGGTAENPSKVEPEIPSDGDPRFDQLVYSAPEAIRTPDPRFRRPLAIEIIRISRNTPVWTKIP
jgi:site-specific DNA recombinase